MVLRFILMLALTTMAWAASPAFAENEIETDAANADETESAATTGVPIIDETVEVIHRTAMELVGSHERFRQYASSIADADYMSAHDDLRRK